MNYNAFVLFYSLFGEVLGPFHAILWFTCIWSVINC